MWIESYELRLQGRLDVGLLLLGVQRDASDVSQTPVRFI